MGICRAESHSTAGKQTTDENLALRAGLQVDWYPWGEEALEKAKREDKPIFLSVGYATCHW
jgi:uncharacterized protein YyaL (SSP411 family)